jgi:hypothetical protein
LVLDQIRGAIEGRSESFSLVLGVELGPHGGVKDVAVADDRFGSFEMFGLELADLKAGIDLDRVRHDEDQRFRDEMTGGLLCNGRRSL